MWSSVRRYRGRNNRHDDLNFTCTCVTDWCFTWCSNQCSKKSEHRASLSSDTSQQSEEEPESKCCTLGNCFVHTTQVQQNVQPDSQVLHEDSTEIEQVDWNSQPPAIEAEPEKIETSHDEVRELSYWAFLRRLRRFRPRFLGGRSSDTAVTSDVPKLSGLQRLGAWFRQLGHRVRLAPFTPDTTATPSSVIAEEITEANVGEYAHDRGDVSPWDEDPFIVFARGKCGYESFDPNCCRLWQTINYSITEERHNGTSFEEKRPASASRDFKVPDVAKPGCKRPVDAPKPKLLSDQSVQQTSVTMIRVASEPQAQASDNKDLPHGSKQTLVHTPDSMDIGKEFTEIEKPDVARDIFSLIGSSSSPRDLSDNASAMHPEQVSMLKTTQPKIPEVILTRAVTPDAKIEDERSTADSALDRSSNKALQRQQAIDSESQPKPKQKQAQGKEEQESDSVKADILNFMIRSSPKSVQSPGIRLETSKSGTSDIKRKIVRFKEPSFSHSTTKGRAVYIGTSKHASASKREIIDCLSITVEETQVSGGVSFHDTNPIRTVLQGSNTGGSSDPDQEGSGSPKGVKEYVNEYSELCKASVDQERQILQTVIDSVRECYKVPTTLVDDKKESKETADSGK